MSRVRTTPLSYVLFNRASGVLVCMCISKKILWLVVIRVCVLVKLQVCMCYMLYVLYAVCVLAVVLHCCTSMCRNFFSGVLLGL